MKTIKTLLLVLVALAVAMPAVAQPSRLYDNQVKSLLEQSKQSFEKFWDAMDGQAKGSVFKGPDGEFSVKKIAEDYKKTIELAMERFTDSYSASTEISAVLRDAVRPNNFVTRQGIGMKGASEWAAHVAQIKQLAGEYGAAFPPVEGQSVRRYTDKELKAAAEGVEQSAKALASAFDSALKKDKAMAAPARQAAVADVKALGENAKALASRIGGAQPASAQVTALFDQAKKAKATLSGSSAAAATQAGWAGISKQFPIIATGFHTTWAE
jgi:hypothetical protein